MKARICGFRVLIKQDSAEEKTEWGFVLEASEEKKKLVQNAVYTGELIQVGPTAWYDYSHKYGKKICEPWARIGDRVLFTKHGGRYVEIPDTAEDENYVVVNDGDVLMVLDKEDNKK